MSRKKIQGKEEKAFRKKEIYKDKSRKTKDCNTDIKRNSRMAVSWG